MNPSINSLLGPLEAATRQGSWEDVEDIADAISRLARVQRLSELKRLESALAEKFKAGEIRDGFHVKIAPGGSQVAKTPPPVDSFTETHQSIASELLEKLKDPAWVAQVKAGGWDIEALRKAATKAFV